MQSIVSSRPSFGEEAPGLCAKGYSAIVVLNLLGHHARSSLSAATSTSLTFSGLGGLVSLLVQAHIDEIPERSSGLSDEQSLADQISTRTLHPVLAIMFRAWAWQGWGCPGLSGLPGSPGCVVPADSRRTLKHAAVGPARARGGCSPIGLWVISNGFAKQRRRDLGTAANKKYPGTAGARTRRASFLTQHLLMADTARPAR